MTSTLPRRCNSAEFRKKIQSRTQNPIKQYTSAVSEKIEALKTKCLIEGKVFTKELLRTSTFPSSETYHRFQHTPDGTLRQHHRRRNDAEVKECVPECLEKQDDSGESVHGLQDLSKGKGS